MSDFEKLVQAILQFGSERDWEQFHDPKNLAEALAIECGELLEVFLWKDCGQSRELADRELEMAREEVADIFIFLVYLSDSLGIDFLEAVRAKLEKNEEKYPRDKARGSSKKYSELDR